MLKNLCILTSETPKNTTYSYHLIYEFLVIHINLNTYYWIKSGFIIQGKPDRMTIKIYIVHNYHYHLTE
jgi:hypothetical protein